MQLPGTKGYAENSVTVTEIIAYITRPRTHTCKTKSAPGRPNWQLLMLPVATGYLPLP